jgi:hypothetical protein
MRTTPEPSPKHTSVLKRAVSEIFRLPLISHDENPVQRQLWPDLDRRKLHIVNKFISFMYFISPYIFGVLFFVTAAYINSLSQIFVQYLMTSRDKVFLAHKIAIFDRIQNFSVVNNLNATQQFELLGITSNFFIDDQTHFSVDGIHNCTPSNCTIEGSNLYDIGFAIIPEIVDKDGQTRVADVYLNIMIALAILRALYYWDSFPRTFRRWTIIHGTLFTIRGLSIAMTVLPNPYKRCKPVLSSSPYVSAFLVMVGSNATCADVFFSGHAAMMGLSAMIFTSTMTSRITITKMVVWIVTFCGWIVIVATRFHYTLDVFYGAVLSIIVWKTYHLIIESAYTKNNIFVVWFEGRKFMSDDAIIHIQEDEFRQGLINEKLTREIFEFAGLPYDQEFYIDVNHHDDIPEPVEVYVQDGMPPPEETPRINEKQSLLETESH